MLMSEDCSKDLKCCFTGYRPSKLPFNVYKRDKVYNDFENMIISGVLKVMDEGCCTFYSGMAMGFDIICAETVILLKQIYKYPLKLVCAVPFEGQGESFTPHWRDRYNNVLAQSDEVRVLSDSYYKGCYQKRNRFMVDSCDYVLTWFDGKAGGTKNTIDYAMRNHKYVFNLNTENDYTNYMNMCFELL